jgi:broad specificity phosphatase PhoE
VFLIRHGQTEFNRVFSVTRRDPGVRDPCLTEIGRSQAAAIARAPHLLSARRLITSPYIRALETAEIIAERLGLPITIEPMIAERFCFTCDIGSPLAELRTRWPDLDFDRLRDPWWPQLAAARRNRGGNCPPLRELPLPDRKRSVVRDRSRHALGIHPRYDRAQSTKWRGVAD